MTIYPSPHTLHNAYLLTGSNLLQPQAMLQQAANAIVTQELGEIIATSSLYQTEAWGKNDQPDFLNQAILLKTPLSPEALLNRLLNIELKMGRKRLQKNDPRIIDIDIIFYDNLFLKTEHLTIPHPLMHLRRFVLEPLNELSPQFLHPVAATAIA